MHSAMCFCCGLLHALAVLSLAGVIFGGFSLKPSPEPSGQSHNSCRVAILGHQQPLLTGEEEEEEEAQSVSAVMPSRAAGGNVEVGLLESC